MQTRRFIRGNTMTMDWFKLHHEIADDIKIRRFSPQEKWAWIVLLCLASKSSERGIIFADDDDIADYCEFNTKQDWLYYRDKLIAKGMLEKSVSGNLLILNWEKRQSRKPSDDPQRIKERVAKSRANKKTQSTSEFQDDVTRYEAIQSPCNANVTPQIRLDETRSEEIRSDHMHIENEKSFSQNVSDRVESLKQSEADKWSSQKIDCKALSKDKDFLDYIQTTYLPSVPDYRGKEIDFALAASWIVKGVRNPERRDIIEIQYEAMIKKQSRPQKSRSQSKTFSGDRKPINYPHPSTWTDDQRNNWTEDQWREFTEQKDLQNV